MAKTEENMTTTTTTKIKAATAAMKKAAISWTGGKDCNLAFWETTQQRPDIEIVCLVCFRPEVNKFHAHPISFMKEQAKSIGLPLYFVNISKDCKDYKTAYVQGIKQLIKIYNIDIIVTGDMDYVGDVTYNWMEERCKESNVQVYLPLWMTNREENLLKLIQHNFDVIFTCVKTPWFTSNWVGRHLTIQTLDELKQISSSRKTNKDVHERELYKPLDLGGERGEYHTMCINGPFYKYPIDDSVLRIHSTPIELQEQLSMKIPEERWWSINVEVINKNGD